MNLVKKFLTALCAVAMIGSLAACGSSSSSAAPVTSSASGMTAPAQASAEPKGKLRVGTSADFPPFEFHAMDEKGNDKIVGADIKLAEYVCEQLGYELEIVDMSFDGLIGSLNEGAFDMVVAGLSIDPERDCIFSQPYYGLAQVVLTKATNKDMFATTDALKGKKVGGLLGSIQEGLAKQYAGETAVILPNFQDSVMMLQEGQLDAVICESSVADSAIIANPELVKANAEIIIDTNNVAIGFKKGNEALRDKVDAVLNTVVAEKMVDKWVLEFQAQAETAK